jgi:hypothetical protein
MNIIKLLEFFRQKGCPEIDGYAWLRGEISPSAPDTIIVFKGDVLVTNEQYARFCEGWAILVTGTLEVLP